MNFEEEHEAILQNLETSLAIFYVDDPEMTDWEAKKAVDALIRLYQAEQRKRTTPVLKLEGVALEAFENAHAMAERCMGRDTGKDIRVGPIVQLDPKPVDVVTIVACLKRIRKSIQTWTKRAGRRGYYDFVREFLML